MSDLRTVFISHSSRDQEWVRAFSESLSAHGIQVWVDYDIQAGKSLVEETERGLRESDTIIFVLTPENVRQPNLIFELGAAVGLGKRVVPILSRGLEPSTLPFPLKQRQGILRDEPHKTAETLLRNLAA
jgi:hypothetical protein